MRIKSCLFKFNEFHFHCCCILFGQSDGLLSAGPGFQRALVACSSGVSSPSTSLTEKNITVGNGEQNSALKLNHQTVRRSIGYSLFKLHLTAFCNMGNS